MKHSLEQWVPKLNRLLANRLTNTAVASARSHGLNHWQVILLTRGVLEYGRPPHRRTFGVGDLILTPPHVPLYYESQSRWSCCYAVFVPWPHWSQWLDWPALSDGTRTFRLPDARARSTVRALFDEVIVQGRAGYRGEQLGLNALERLLITIAGWNQASRHPDRDPRIAVAQQFLRDNLTRMVAVPEVAQAAGMSGSRLAHLFRRETGLTPMQFLDRERMQRACQLLANTPLPVKDIAVQVGYPDIYHFSQRFKKLLGRSPTAYRQQQVGRTQ